MAGKRAATALVTSKRVRKKVERLADQVQVAAVSANKGTSAVRELGGKPSYRPGQAPKSAPVATVLPGTQPLPTRNKRGRLVFADHPEFSPNLTPAEVLQRGSFGGTYFRPIDSGT